MLPKSYVVFKWTVYALASLLLFALQSLLLSHIRVMGVTPFLYPILPAAAAMSGESPGKAEKPPQPPAGSTGSPGGQSGP
mgnify:CR=1 FL=1